MSRVPATAVTVCPVIDPTEHAIVGVPVSSRPLGRVSLKPTPVKAVLFGLVNEKVRVLTVGVPPLSAMVVGEKDLERVGTTGRGQPAMVMLSNNALAVGSLLPTRRMRNQVFETPVVAAVSGPRDVKFFEIEVAENISVKLVPSALEYT